MNSNMKYPLKGKALNVGGHALCGKKEQGFYVVKRLGVQGKEGRQHSSVRGIEPRQTANGQGPRAPYEVGLQKR